MKRTFFRRSIDRLTRWLIFSASLWGLCLRSAAADAVDFHKEIVPLLTRSGCNSGACHGAAVGRGNLQLSLLGSRPGDDYVNLVYAFEGRRVNVEHVERSLLLRKPSSQLDHGGGDVLPADSAGYQLLKRWLVEGARLGSAEQLQEFRIESQPIAAQVVALTAWATWTDDQPYNVTSLTLFSADDPEAVEIINETADAATQRVRLLRPGQHVVLARYLDRVVPLQVRLPFAHHDRQPLNSQLTTNNFVDQELHHLLAEMQLTAGPAIDDYAYLRRATLDLTGRLPEVETIEAFGADERCDKRERLIDRLLTSAAFVDYWTLRTARLLELHGLPNETRAVETYHHWIRESISKGTPWPEMVQQLLTATGDAKQVGPANFARMVNDPRAHAELVSRVFMGARLGCANCHDHPLDRWTQADYHGLASILARVDRGPHVRLLERGAVTNPRTRQPATPRLPGTRDLVDHQAPLDALAKWITDESPDTLARAFANRTWQAVMGRGLVEAVDDLRDTNPPSHPQLLDKLVSSTLAHQFDLRHLLRTIVLSESYARHSSADADTFYAHVPIKPLPPEAWLDAIADVTGVQPDFSEIELSAARDASRAVHIVDPLMKVPALDTLGRCSRVSCAASPAQVGLATQLHLVNGELISGALRNPTGRLGRMLAQRVPYEVIVKEFVTRAWSRPPTKTQLAAWCQQIDSPEALEDFLWALLCSDQFQKNH